MLSSRDASAAAVRRTARTRVEARLVDQGSTRMLLVTHVPDEPASSGVLICPSVFAESVHNYRREVLLAEALAERGIPVQRFHYRGCGQSGGRFEDISFASMCEDAARASTFLRECVPIERMAYMGTRVGALVTGSIAESAAPIALWHPTMTGRAFFREAARARRMTDLRMNKGDSPRGDIAGEIDQNGRADLLGYALGRDLFESLGEISLRTAMPAPRDVLLVTIGRRPDEFAKLAAEWRAVGSTIDEEFIPSQETWWFFDERGVRSESILQVTTDWMLSRLAGVTA